MLPRLLALARWGQWKKETKWRRSARSRSGPKVARDARRHNDVYGCFSRRRSRALRAPIGSAARCARAELRQSDTKIERRLRSLALPGLEMGRRMAEFGRAHLPKTHVLAPLPPSPATGERGPLRSSQISRSGYVCQRLVRADRVNRTSPPLLCQLV